MRRALRCRRATGANGGNGAVEAFSPIGAICAVAIVAAIALLGGSGATAARADDATKDAGAAGLALGGRAPDFSLPNLAGDAVTLSKLLESGPVLIDFWALWCKPCLQSLPGTDAIRAKYAERGLTVLAINTDSPRSNAKVKSYVRSNRFEFDVLLDPNGSMQRLYRFYRIPQTFLVAPDGSIAFSQLGYSPGTEERVASAIDRVFAAAAPATPATPAQEPKGE